ncbi:MAG: HlyD family efflux transporter periplasmic adaptor subunit [Burkholderiaceae bacterium]|nr:HlyD family efflux transporter periplasmic adaptor subunit [Burkholderiaceae bacterium]
MDLTIKKGLWVLMFIFVGFVAWAALVPLDAGVPSNGMVTVDGRRKVVQHPRGGVIQQVMIREGDTVTAGDVLVRLDNSTELGNRSQSVAQLHAAQSQSEALEAQLPGLRDLVEDGFYPRNQLIDLERKLKEAKAQQRGLRDQIAALDKELERTVIRAPISGRVMGVGVNTEGAVVIAGAKLMEVVPINDQVTIEAQVRPHLVDKVIPGASAQVRFSALQSSITPVILGTVEWISPDRFQTKDDPANSEGYYLAKVIVGQDELTKVNGLRIIPGMPADVIIKTGERTLFQYLFKPISDRFAHALKEY